MDRYFVLAACLTLVAATATATATASQPTEARERARIHNTLGWSQMSAEQFEDAARAFQQAVDIDKSFAEAYYGLGRANMALKKYVLAVDALSTCRDLYSSDASKRFSNQQDAQRARSDRLTEIDEQIRQVQGMPVTLQQQDLLRQLDNQRRDIQNALTTGSSLSITNPIPPWVSLSLGSAYFRSGKLADAEREYKATVAADPRSGEALNNLAVVYLETDRIADAEAALKSAKKVGFKVNPQLELAIQKKKSSR